MAMVKTKPTTGSRPGRARPQDVDRWVGQRMRERRVMLGLTQQQMAELIGVTYQQAHKYETGINRIAAGRLHLIAKTLGVDVSYFFEGLGDAADCCSSWHATSRRSRAGASRRRCVRWPACWPSGVATRRERVPPVAQRSGVGPPAAAPVYQRG
jgi:transcriptional regulator with XRE-family HTH domain